MKEETSESNIGDKAKGHALMFSVNSGPGYPVGSGCAAANFCATTKLFLIILRLSTPLEHQNISIQPLIPPSVDPVALPVTFPFENAVGFITVIDPVSGWHSVVCNLCDQSISLGIWAASAKTLLLERITDSVIPKPKLNPKKPVFMMRNSV